MKNIQITPHIKGNDFNAVVTWSVANFDKMTEIEKVEYTGTVTENTVNYYKEMGYTEIAVTETGERFNRKYKITMKRHQPEIATFKTEYEARKYAKTI